MGKIDVYELVTTLIGPIEPVGETHTDDKRLENLKAMCVLVDKLIRDIDGLYLYNDSPRFSEKRAATYAREFLDELGIAE